MRIGVLRLSLVGVDKAGQYNAQFLGVSKALDKHFDEVIVYKNIYKSQKAEVSHVEGCKNTTLHLVPVKNIGINGLVDTSVLDNTLDAFLLFSDVQISVPKVYKWTKQHNIIFLPYVGVLESHSNSAIKRILMKLFALRAVAVYKKSDCIAKTPEIKNKLIALGVKNIRIMPAGLDMTLVHQGVADNDEVKQIRENYGYENDEKIILFVGRMEQEKNPVLMIKLFGELIKRNPNYRLLMVGSGALEEDVIRKINELSLNQQVARIGSIPNNEMWKLYSISDSFVNLNQQEIFGMAILEAMLYGTKVVALHAPGPDYIIEDGISGLLCNSESEIIESVCNKTVDRTAAKNRILNNFTWDVTSQVIVNAVNEIRQRKKWLTHS